MVEVGSQVGVGLWWGQIYLWSLHSLLFWVGISGIRVFRVLVFNIRITRNNFEYWSLLPEVVIGFGFFGYGFRVSDNMPSFTGQHVFLLVVLPMWSLMLSSGAMRNHLREFLSGIMLALTLVSPHVVPLPSWRC